MSFAQNKNGNADEIEHHGGNVHHVVRPIAPAGEKAVEVAENFFRPEIDAAFSRVTMSELNHGNSLRPEKKNQRDHPQPDRDAAVGGDRRNNIQVEDSDHKKQNEIPSSQNPPQVRCFLRRGPRGYSDDLVRQRSSLLGYSLTPTSVRP